MRIYIEIKDSKNTQYKQWVRVYDAYLTRARVDHRSKHRCDIKFVVCKAQDDGDGREHEGIGDVEHAVQDAAGGDGDSATVARPLRIIQRVC